MIDGYDWAGGREAMLRFGPVTGPLVLVAPALFEEANRTRAFTVAILRGLAERGIASALPDLPGQGESMVPTSEARLAGWREAFAAAAIALQRDRQLDGIVSIRAGALVDTLVPLHARWHLSPVDGEALLKDLHRLQRLFGDAPAEGDEGPIEIAGNLVSPALLSDLASASVRPARVVRLETDPRSADRKLPGTPLWRGSEPTTNSVLSELLANDIAEWVRACAA